MCKFNPQVVKDENNYDVVEGNVVELCEEAAKQLGERSHPTMINLPVLPSSISPTLISATPSVPRATLPGSPLAPSSQDDDDLARRLHELRR